MPQLLFEVVHQTVSRTDSFIAIDSALIQNISAVEQYIVENRLAE